MPDGGDGNEAEVVGVDEPPLQLEQGIGVVVVAFLVLHIAAHEAVGELCALEDRFAHAVAWAGVDAQGDVGGILGHIHIHTRRARACAQVATPLYRGEKIGFPLLPGGVHETVTRCQREAVGQDRKLPVTGAIALEGDGELAHLDAGTDLDRVGGEPVVAILHEFAADLGPVVAVWLKGTPDLVRGPLVQATHLGRADRPVTVAVQPGGALQLLPQAGAFDALDDDSHGRLGLNRRQRCKQEREDT